MRRQRACQKVLSAMHLKNVLQLQTAVVSAVAVGNLNGEMAADRPTYPPLYTPQVRCDVRLWKGAHASG